MLYSPRMRTQAAKQILVIVDITYLSGREQLSGIYRFAARRPDWRILLRTDTEFQPVNAQDLAGRVDGIILKTGRSLQTVTKLADAGIPVALIDSPHDSDLRPRESVVVISDNVNVGRAAADHFGSLGRFSAYGFVADPCDYEWSRARHAGFRTALRNHGREVVCFHQTEGVSAHQDVSELAAWLKSLPRPIAIFAAYDARASRVIEACQRARLSVPRDVSIIGVDNDPLVCENTRPRLTSIKLDNEGQGFAAAQALAHLLGQRARSSRPRTILCPHLRVVERESTASVVPASYLVERINKLIDACACEGVTVHEIARELDISYRLLILRYRQFCGTTLREALIQRRLKEVRHLLKATDYPMTKIAKNCGFRSNVVLSHLFARRFGCSMGAWREQARAERKPASRSAGTAASTARRQTRGSGSAARGETRRR